MPDPILENTNEKVLKQKRVPNSYIERYPALSASAEKRAYTPTPWFDKVTNVLGRGFDTIYGGAKAGVGTALGAGTEIGGGLYYLTDKLGVTDDQYSKNRALSNSIWGDVAASAKDVVTLGGARANAARVAKHMEDLKRGGGILGMSGETAANVAGYSDDTANFLTSLLVPAGALSKIPGATATLARVPFLKTPLTASGLLQGGAYVGAPAAAVTHDMITNPARIAGYTASVNNAIRKVNDALSKHDSLMPEKHRLALVGQLHSAMVANPEIDPGELADAALQQAGYDGDPTFGNRAISTLKDVGGKGADMLGAGDWYKKLSPTAQAAIPALLGAGGLGLGGYALYKMLSGGDEEKEETPEEKRRQLMRRAKTASAYPALTKAADLTGMSDEELDAYLESERQERERQYSGEDQLARVMGKDWEQLDPSAFSTELGNWIERVRARDKVNPPTEEQKSHEHGMGYFHEPLVSRVLGAADKTASAYPALTKVAFGNFPEENEYPSDGKPYKPGPGWVKRGPRPTKKTHPKMFAPTAPPVTQAREAQGNPYASNAEATALKQQREDQQVESISDADSPYPMAGYFAAADPNFRTRGADEPHVPKHFDERGNQIDAPYGTKTVRGPHWYSFPHEVPLAKGEKAPVREAGIAASGSGNLTPVSPYTPPALPPGSSGGGPVAMNKGGSAMYPALTKQSSWLSQWFKGTTENTPLTGDYWKEHAPDAVKRRFFESDPGSHIAPELQKTISPYAKAVADFTGVQGVNTAANEAAQVAGQRAGDVYSGASQQNKDIAWDVMQKRTDPTAAAGQFMQNAVNNPGQAASDVGNAAKDFVWGK